MWRRYSRERAIQQVQRLANYLEGVAQKAEIAAQQDVRPHLRRLVTTSAGYYWAVLLLLAATLLSVMGEQMQLISEITACGASSLAAVAYGYQHFANRLLRWFYSHTRRLTVLGFLVAISATWLTNQHLSSVFGLPATDFLITLAIAHVMWCVIVCFAIAMASFLVYGISATVIMTKRENRPFQGANAMAEQIVGSMLFFATVGALASTAVSASIPSNNTLRLIAYDLDYRELWNYPGLECGKRVVLHANGVVSYAMKSSGNDNIVRIVVSKIDDRLPPCGKALD